MKKAINFVSFLVDCEYCEYQATLIDFDFDMFSVRCENCKKEYAYGINVYKCYDEFKI